MHAGAKSDRVLIVAISIVAASTFIVLASFNYMLPTMQADLGLNSDETSLALKIPSLASLLMVFAAGRMGDKLGHRRVILVAGLFFIAGCLTVAFAQGMLMLAIGMFFEGLSAVAIQIVAVGLLASRFVEPKARAKAFAIYGMAYPAVYLIFPVIAGWLATFVTWRAIPIAWAIGGVVLLVTTLFLLPSATRLPVGELMTPILAGIFAVGVVQFISHASDYGLLSWQALTTITVGLLALLLCAVLYRRLPAPSLSIAPLKNGATTILLTVVILVPILNTFFYITFALQYMYGKSAFETAVLMVPAQLAAILGARILSERMTERLGLKRSGVLLLIALAGVLALALTFSGTTPLWWILVYACLFGAVVTGVGVVVLNALMSTAPADEGGNTAAYDGAATEVGIALGVVLMSGLVFGVGQMSLNAQLEASGLTAEESASVFADMQAQSTSPQLNSAYTYPLPDGADVSDLQQQAIADGLRVNGAAGVVIALVCAGLFAVHRRQEGDDVEEYAEQEA